MRTPITVRRWISLGLAGAAALQATRPEHTAESSLRVAPDLLLAEALASAVERSSLDAAFQFGAIVDGVDSAWRLSNRGAGIESFAAEDRLWITAFEGRPWSWSVSATSLSREDATQELQEPELSVDGRYAEYRRGALREWWLNDEAGLAWGLTLERRQLAGEAPLRVSLDLHGDLELWGTASDRWFALRDRCGEHALEVSGLAAWDATGRELAVRFVAEDGLAIELDDRGAVYPITVDPLIVGLVVKLVPAAVSISAGVGLDVALDGNRAAVIGHGTNSGWFYVFERVGGFWFENFRTRVVVPAQGNGAILKSVSLSGDTVLIGDLEEPGGGWNGEAHAYTRRGGVWQYETRFSPHFGWWSYETMGWDVKLHEDYAFIGNPDHTHGGGANYQGCVYIYRRDPAANGEFAYQSHLLTGIGYTGSSLDADGDMLAAASTGGVHLFQRSGSGWQQSWNQVATVPGQAPPYVFRVALKGDTLLVGDPRGAGSVRVFIKSGGSWTLQQTLTASDGASGDAFGEALDFVGDSIAVGAPGDDSGGVDAGAVYLFTRNGGWRQELELRGADTDNYDRFGVSVDGDGTRLLVGAQGDSASAPNSGSAYLFKVSSSIASVYCVGKVNSLGCVPVMAFSGSPSATSGAPFVVEARSVLNQRNGVMFYGTNGRDAVPFQGGVRCVATPVRRMDVIGSGGSPAPANDCSGVYSVDFNAWINSGVDAALVAGADVDAQCWSRDPSASFGVGLSEAIEFTILP